MGEQNIDNSTPEQPRPRRKSRLTAWVIFWLLAAAMLGGIIGGVIGVGVLERLGVSSDFLDREVILQESSVIIDVAEKLEPSVVSITTEQEPTFDIFGREFEGRTGAGTGIIVSDDGLVLTNRHVIPDDTGITVMTSDGRIFESVEVVDRDPFNDIAFLQLDGDEEFVAAELGDSDQVVVGQRVIAIGNALGQFSNTVTSGIISGIGRPVVAGGRGASTEQLLDLFQTDAAINPGNSGGPLVNISGQVIGVNTAIADNAEGIGFAIPINQTLSVLKSVREEGRIVRPYIGVRYVTLNPDIAEREGIDTEEGALLVASNAQSAVLPGSPADEAGLEDGDVITEINGIELTQENSLASVIGQFRVGDDVTLRIVRDGEPIDVDLTLAELPRD